jgi:hypothetical protein
MLTWYHQRKAPDGCDLYRIAIPKIPAMRFHQSLGPKNRHGMEIRLMVCSDTFWY